MSLVVIFVFLAVFCGVPLVGLLCVPASGRRS